MIIFLINLFLFFDFMGGLIFPILCHLSLNELGDVLEDDGFEIELILLMGCIFADFLKEIELNFFKRYFHFHDDEEILSVVEVEKGFKLIRIFVPLERLEQLNVELIFVLFFFHSINITKDHHQYITEVRYFLDSTWLNLSLFILSLSRIPSSGKYHTANAFRELLVLHNPAYIIFVIFLILDSRH